MCEKSKASSPDGALTFLAVGGWPLADSLEGRIWKIDDRRWYKELPKLALSSMPLYTID